MSDSLSDVPAALGLPYPVAPRACHRAATALHKEGMRTSTAPPPVGSISERRRSTDLVAIVVVAFVVAVIGALVTRPPDRLPTLTVANPTPYELHLSSIKGDALAPIGIVSPDGSATVTEVADPGEAWEVRVLSQGRVVTFTTTRSAVEAAGWRLTVPDEVAGELAATGAPPAPGHGEGPSGR